MKKTLCWGWLVMLAVVHIMGYSTTLLVVVVHNSARHECKKTPRDINRKARLILVPYQEGKIIERRCAEDSV